MVEWSFPAPVAGWAVVVFKLVEWSLPAPVADWAVVVDQMVEWSLQKPSDPGSKPVLVNYYG